MSIHFYPLPKELSNYLSVQPGHKEDQKLKGSTIS